MAKHEKHEEYDWLNDPFDEKKQAAEEQMRGMSKGSKLAVGIGCLAILVILILLLIFGCVGTAALLNPTGLTS